jgi:hypothetical protein
MPALGKVELELLDFLCCAAFFRCRVTKIKPGPASALQSLRWAGLVELTGFEPSPWAFHDWLERQDGERLIERIYETSPSLRIPREKNPPEPVAGEEGGGAAARDGSAVSIEAPPPIQTKRKRQARTSKNNRGASGTARKAPGATPSGVASSGSASAPSTAPPPLSPAGAGEPSMHAAAANDEESPVCESSKTAASGPPRDPTKPPPGYQSRPEPFTIAAPEARAGLSASPKRQAIIEEARKRNAAGLSSGEKGINVHVRMAQRAIADQDAEAARMADPVEQAKIVLRKRFSPVVSAEILDPPGPKGMFLVGRKLVDKAELLAMAEQLAA